MTTITIRNDILCPHGVTLPCGRNNAYRRAPGAVTLKIGNLLHSGLAVEFDLDPDGSLNIRSVLPSKSDNSYIHFAIEPTELPTEGQKRALMRCQLGIERIYGSGVGAPVMRWAGMTADAASAQYGDGSRIAINIPAA